MSSAPARPPPPAHREFLEAWQRVQSGAPDEPDPPALQHHLLYDYLLAARLRRDLQRAPDDALDARIAGFVESRADLPVVRPLRREWLLSLGARARWDLFLPLTAGSADAQLQCQRFAGRLATAETAGLGAEVLARWRLPQPAPPECGAAFAWARSQGLFTAALAEDRTRAALEAGNLRLAREAVEDVPAPRNEPLLQWILLLQTPRAELEALMRDPARGVEPAALVAGFSKFAVADFVAAAALLPALLQRTDLPEATKGQLRRAAALGAAWSRNLDAVSAFDEVPAATVDAMVQEWRVRSALWAGNFRRAQDWITQMPPELAAQPRWRYWRARALERNEGEDAAQPLYAELASLRDYYGYLAADRAHRHYRLDPVPLEPDAKRLKQLSAEPGLARARALFECGLTDEAGVEWAVAIADADVPTRTQAAILASRWGWYSQSIALLAQLGAWDDVKLRYPRPFAPEIAAASHRTRVPPDWIDALMRQESLFRTDAVSAAGARGLLQVMPATAAALARRWKIPYESRDALFEPSTAILLGAAHLREVLDKYQDDLPLALAAYNAGAVPVSRWRPSQPMDADIWVENIPYAETRGYVQRVLEHIVAFAWVRKAALPHLATLMPAVNPR
ncbi:MAG: transglycosylase SLT domain-containing protein [Steroidobacteraceae bacterium]